MAASAQRYPRDILLETDAEYQRLAEQHSKYEAELQKLSATPYLNSEDLLEETCTARLARTVSPSAVVSST